MPFLRSNLILRESGEGGYKKASSASPSLKEWWTFRASPMVSVARREQKRKREKEPRSISLSSAQYTESPETRDAPHPDYGRADAERNHCKSAFTNVIGTLKQYARLTFKIQCARRGYVMHQEYMYRIPEPHIGKVGYIFPLNHIYISPYTDRCLPICDLNLCLPPSGERR